MNIISGIGESGFLAHSAFSAGIATKDSNGNDITATYLTGVDLTPYQTTAGMVNYQTTADMVNYQTTAAMTAYQEAGSYLSANALDNVSGDWNEVSAKLDTTAFSDVSGSFLTAVPDTYLQNTDLEISDNKITGISGIPLSAGGDVPEGVMVESGLEYNAVDEISGYNGSAFAQYGAEKQWLQHDDTIVHVSNSAQYAFGVNLSAVAQLLGVDETVLFTGNSVSAQCSEPLSSFNKIRVKIKTPAFSSFHEETLDASTSAGFFICGGGVHYYGGVIITSGSTVKVGDGTHVWFNANGCGSEASTSTVQQVIGIGRKS